jgi:teichuronic acid biosynthesis glycosyltransferase TuaC
MTDALWVVPAYPWEQEPVGGVFFRTQAAALARHGFGVVVACPTPWAPWPLTRLRERWRRYAAAPATRREQGVLVIRPRYPNIPGQPGWALPDRMIAAAAWRRRAVWRPARVIHGHSAVTGLAAWRLARRTGLPFVLTFHGGDLYSWPDAHPDRLDDLRTAAREARAVIAVSEALAARARDVTGVAALHLPLGSDHRALAASLIPRDQARDELGLPAGRRIALFLGNLLEAKGVHELVDAVLPRRERWLAVLVGDGPERGYGTADARASGAVEYRGPQPHSEVARYLCAADVLVLPSRSEGLPTVLVEAGSVGLPVIASAVGGIPDLLAEGRGALLGDVSSGAVGEALDAFALDPRPAEAAAARLRAHVLAHHDVDANAARLLTVYGLEPARAPTQPPAAQPPAAQPPA